MSVKLIALVHWLISVWPYAVGTIVALFFVLLKGLPVLHELFSVFIFGWRAKKLEDDPQLAFVNDGRPEKSSVKKISQPQMRSSGINRNRWLIRIGIVNFCIGFVALVVWLFAR
jgi:hypothetical protein